MNTNVVRCLDMQETNIVKEIQLGGTKVKFCNDYIAKTKEEREQRIREFKQASLNLIEAVLRDKTKKEIEGGEEKCLEHAKEK